MAANLKNAASIYKYILAQPLTAAYTLSPAVKTAYANVRAARKFYHPDADTHMKAYAVSGLKGSAEKFAKLVDMYNAQYLQNAALAGEQTRRASEAAGGVSYAAPAAQAALDEVMAARTAAVPKLMQAAAYAHANDLAEREAGVQAALRQRQMNEDTARALYEAVYNIADKKDTSLQKARDVKADALADWYDLQSSLEKGSSSSGRRRSSSGRRSSKKKKTTKKTETQQWENLSPDAYYKRICYKYPGISGYLMTPSEYARHHDIDSYRTYVDSVMEATGFGKK